MTKAKGRAQERRLPKISGAPEVNQPSQDADEEEEGQVEVIPMPLTDEDRIILRMETGLRGQLLDFAFVQQVKDGGQWQDVVRYDCEHDTVHMHRFTKGGTGTSRKEICGLDQIEEGYEIVNNAIFDGWEENRRRYFYG
jgi:hypothetical protein